MFVAKNHAFLALLVAALAACVAQPLVAQTKKKGERISGTVVSIEKAKTGRSHLLKMKTKSEEIEFDIPIVPRTQLAIDTEGDSAFLQAHAVVSGTVFPDDDDSGDFRFNTDIVVHLGTQPIAPQFKRVPAPDPLEVTQYEIVGKIVGIQDDNLQVQCGPQLINVYVVEGETIMVRLSDPSRIKEGDQVEIDGTIVKGKQTINANAIHVKSEASITAKDYFASLNDKKSKPAKTIASKSKKEATTGVAPSEADPFGVLKNKAKGKSAAENDAGMEVPKTTKPGVKKAKLGAQAAPPAAGKAQSPESAD